MSNLRVVYDNVADSATVVASSTQGALVASNLLLDAKSSIWRGATATAGVAASATLTATLSGSKTVGCIALPFSSLTNSATIRVRLFTLAADVTPAYDSGVKPAVAGTLYIASGGASTYAYGGGAYAVCWVPPRACQKVVIDLSDGGNLGGYIEAARLVIGDYFSPSYSAEYGASINSMDRSVSMRTDAGDARTERGTMNKELNFVMDFLTATDRNTLWSIFRRNGMFSPVFVSLLPEDSDSGQEQIYQIYGKLARSGAINYKFFDQFNSTVTIEEI